MLGIPPKSFHKMRSSFCSILLLNNVDIKTVSAAMGHSQLNITLSRYAKEFEEGKKSAANKLDDIFNSSSESA